jgi:hypothetical protein
VSILLGLGSVGGELLDLRAEIALGLRELFVLVAEMLVAGKEVVEVEEGGANFLATGSRDAETEKGEQRADDDADEPGGRARAEAEEAAAGLAQTVAKDVAQPGDEGAHKDKADKDQDKEEIH